MLTESVIVRLGKGRAIFLGAFMYGILHTSEDVYDAGV